MKPTATIRFARQHNLPARKESEANVAGAAVDGWRVTGKLGKSSLGTMLFLKEKYHDNETK